jgi:hypothetical protein
MTLPDPLGDYLRNNGHGSEDEGDDSDKEEHDESDEERDVSEDGYDSGSESHLRWIDTQNFQVMKLIVCSSDLVAALFWSSRSNLVAVRRPGGSAWSVAWNLSLWITDVAFYQGVDY